MLAHRAEFEFAQILIGDTHVEPTDVLLIDTFGGSQDLLGRMRSAIEDPSIGAVVLYSFTVPEPLIEWAKAVGLSGVISKATHREALAKLLVDAASGCFVQDLGSVSEEIDRSAPLVKDLSFREAEVLALMAAGRTNAEIAQTLYLSVETVKTYVSRVFTKIDVRNRTEAALWAARVGLGQLEDQRVLEIVGQVPAQR